MPVMNKGRKFESVIQSWKESHGDSTISVGSKKANIDLKYWLQRGTQSQDIIHRDNHGVSSSGKESIEIALEQGRRCHQSDSYHSRSSSSSTNSGDFYFSTPRTNILSQLNATYSHGNDLGSFSPAMVPHRKREVPKSEMPLLRFKNNNKEKPGKKREWKSCVDPKSGRTYYYDVRTRETQWAKPIELATQAERRKIEDKETKQREFFKSMESNILRALNSGTVPGVDRKEIQEDEVKELPKRSSLTRTKKPILVRTISSMDDNVLAELAQEEADIDGAKGGIGPFSPDCAGTSFFDSLPQPEVHHPLKNYSPPPTSFGANMPQPPQPARVTPPQDTHSKALRKPALEKRNTCGTLYISNTMSDPDVEATIKCVCGVFRTHIVQSLTEYSSGTKFEDYEVFNDDYREKQTRPFAHLVESEMSIEMMRIDGEDDVPSLDEITDFYRFVFKKAQMENDCIVISLIYVERLMRETNGGVRPNVKNWRSVLFSAMILSSKVWDDLSMWNADFTLACPEGVTFSLQRINQLELALLSCFKYNVKVPASEYAKYYFLIRSLLIRSGLAGQDIISSKKLDTEGAQKLEFLSSNYKKSKPSIVRRSQSENVPNGRGSPMSGRVSLEQVVRM